MLKSKRAEPIILKSCLPKQQNIERAYYLKNFELYGFYLITSNPINNFRESSNFEDI